jgi:hypothetical protein
VTTKSKAKRTAETYFEQVPVKTLRHAANKEKKNVAPTREVSGGTGRKRI